MDSAETPRRRRRAARRAAGPPAQVSTTPVAELPEDAGLDEAELSQSAEAAAAAGSIAAPAEAVPAQAVPAQAVPPQAFPTQAVETDPDPAIVHEVVHGSPGHAPAGPSHTPGPQRDRPERTTGTASSTGEPTRRSGRTSREEASERSLRSLVTTRSTQVSATAALRAREVALPSATDLAAAEESLVMVHRHYVPPTVLAAGRRPDRTGRRPSTQSG